MTEPLERLVEVREKLKDIDPESVDVARLLRVIDTIIAAIIDYIREVDPVYKKAKSHD